jgi:hypothetical protein
LNAIQQLAQAIGDLQQRIKNLQGMGAGHEGRLRSAERQLESLQNALGRVSMTGIGQDNGNAVAPANGGSSWGAPGQVSEHSVRYIESIPGRRVPFDLLVDIPIAANETGTQQGTRTVSQDGPFVAVARMAVFQSAYQFSLRDPETQETATFLGRSFGRWRPISSVNDFNDAGGLLQPVTGIAFPGTGAPIYASPSNHSGFRTMEFDATIDFLNQGSAYPRSNQEVSSAFWGDICVPFQLGALDFFERGETLQWKVRPTHPNNPPFGNCFGYAAGGLFPFLDSQYDVHEGICDPLNPEATVDPAIRLPNGILQIGFHGFRIIQPPGPVRIT